MPEILEIKGVGPVLGIACAGCGYDSVKKVASASVTDLAEVPGVGEARAKALIDSAQLLLGETSSSANGKAEAKNGANVDRIQVKKSKKNGKDKTKKKNKKLKKAKKKEKNKNSKSKKSKNGKKK